MSGRGEASNDFDVHGVQKSNRPIQMARPDGLASGKRTG